MEKRKRGLNSQTIAIIFVLIALLGVGIMMYPIVAAQYSESVRSEIHTQYEEVLQEVDTSEIDAIRASAEKYNRNLSDGVFTPLQFEENGYYEELKLPDTDVMCYISIPEISVYLPVYHGVNENALGKGAGHMPQSSLPIGGKNTHSVISAHTGMAQSPMFSDLELLEIGDIFQVQVLGETMTYEVEDISVVLPQEVESIKIQQGRDLISLITCTPYGINTHRLIVRGYRIENPEEEDVATVPVETQGDTTSVWTNQYWESVKIGAFIAIGIILLLVICFIVVSVMKLRRKRGVYEK